MAPVSADHGTSPRRSDHPVHTSTTGRPSKYTDNEPASRKQVREQSDRAREVRIGCALNPFGQAAVDEMKVRACHKVMMTA
jgi:hypothetical protein